MIGEAQQGGLTPAPAFDEKPIGFQKKFDIPEYAENQDPNMIAEVANPEPKPLGERLKKKIIKVKREAVQELLALVRNDPQQYKPHENLTLELISFNDVQVQDRSLKALVIYLEAGNTLSIDAKTIVKTLIEKCLVSEKEEIKFQSEQALFWYMDHDYEELLLSDLNDNLLHKNKKILGVSLLFIANLLNNYGIKRMKSMERFYKNLGFLSEPAKPNAKGETIALFKEMFKWIGDSVFSDFKLHSDVKDEVVKFSKQYEKVPMEIKRGLKRKVMKGNKPVFYVEEEEPQSKEPIDVLSGYTSQWVENLLKLQKWKEKKEQLDEFIKKIKVPYILPHREQSHFIHLIKKLLSDNNINICYCGFHIIQHLSKGLRRDFSHIGRNVLNEVFVKLKELKPLTVEHAQTTLKTLLNTLSLEDYMENLKEGLKDKSPSMKEQTLKLISHFINKKDNKTISLLRNLTDKIIQMTEDGVVKVRNQALDVLVNLKIIHGMKFFGEKVRSLDPKKLQIIELAKPAVNQDPMEIEENTLPMHNNVQPTLNKEQNTMKTKPTKTMEIEQKCLNTSRVMSKEDNSSLNSNGEYKVPRTLNLNFLEEIGSPNESVRATAYQQIANKYLSRDIRQFLNQMKNNSLKESSSNILKNILVIAKKHINNAFGQLQIAEFIVKHDWKRSKHLLSEFMQTQKFTPEAEQLLKSTGVSLPTTKPVHQNNFNAHSNANHLTSSAHSNPFKTFSIELQNNLISKMSSPLEEVKKEAAERAIQIWQDIPKIGSESELTPANGWQDQHITKFFNIVRYRLTDSSPEVVSIYCQLIMEMLRKGIQAKQKNMKTLVHTVFSGLGKQILPLKELFREMVVSSPSHLFMAMQGEILVDSNQPFLIDFLSQNSDLFIKFADLRIFMIPFLHMLCNSNIEMRHKQTLDSLFHQIVQISGEEALEREVGKMKVSNVQPYNQYLSNYNLSLGKTNTGQSASSKNYRIKENRLKYWEQEGWHFQITSNHILKLCNIMSTLGEPLNSLCNLFTLTYQNLHDLATMEMTFLSEYSDIFFKFIYWRSAVDSSEVISQLLKFTARVLTAVGEQITEIDVILLMRTFLFILERFKENKSIEICEILSKLFKITQQIQQNTFQFWINYLMNHNPSPCLSKNILSILMHSYGEKLTNNLVHLARIPAVHKDEAFLNFLTTKCNPEVLKASGFRVAITKPQKNAQENKQLLTELGGPQNMMQIDPSEMSAFKEMFRQNSQHITSSLAEISMNNDGYGKIEKYVKILYSILTPFFSNEIPFINFFEFVQELIKVTAEEYEYKKKYLRELTRMLLYTLVDVDEKQGTNCQVGKLINRCLLNILETSEPRHLLEILYLLGKQHLELNISVKLVHIIIKCIAKLAKYTYFSLDLKNNITYIYEQNSLIFDKFKISEDSPFIRTFKNLYFDLFKTYPEAIVIFQSSLSNRTHPNIVKFYEEYIELTHAVPEALVEQPMEKRNVNASLNSIRSITTGGINKLSTIKKKSEENA